MTKQRLEKRPFPPPHDFRIWSLGHFLVSPQCLVELLRDCDAGHECRFFDGDNPVGPVYPDAFAAYRAALLDLNWLPVGWIQSFLRSDHIQRALGFDPKIDERARRMFEPGLAP